MIRTKMQFIHQSKFSVARKALLGRLRAALLLFVMVCVPFVASQADTQKAAVYLGDTLIWRCNLLGETGTYTDTENPSYKMKFRTIERVVDEKSVSVCKGDTLLWRCMELWTSNTYLDTVRSLEYPDLDSVYYRLNLTVEEIVPVEQDITIRLGDTLLWRCMEIPAIAVGNMTYSDTVKTVGPVCPDVYVLNLTVDELVAEEVVDNVTICDGDTLLWRCKEVWDESLSPYYDTVKSLLYPASDSIHYTLNLKVNKQLPDAKIDTLYITPAAPSVNWRDQTISAAGEYTDTVRYSGGLGCDSIVYRLRVVWQESQSVKICDGDTLLWRCHELNEDVQLTDTIQSTSIFAPYDKYDKEYYMLDLKISKQLPDAKIDTLYITPAVPSVSWRDQTISAAGEYTDTVRYSGGLGCDSIVYRLRVVWQESQSVKICDGDTLLWRCHELNEDVQLTDTIQSTSIFAPYDKYDKEYYMLDLKINKQLPDAKIDTLYITPAVPSVNWRDQTISAAGEYTDTVRYSGGLGCDSIVYRLRVVWQESQSVKICDGDTLLWRCHELNEDVQLTDTIQSTSIFAPYDKYDKEYYMLDLKINKQLPDAKIDTLYITPAVPSVNWRDQTISAAGEYTDTVRYSGGLGCDSIVYRLRVVWQESQSVKICDGDTLLWRCHELNEDVQLTDTIQSTSIFAPYDKYDKEYYMLDLKINKQLPDADIESMRITRDAPSVSWRDQAISAAGEYTDTVRYSGGLGCDSIVYRLRVVKYDSIAESTCGGDTLLWRCHEAYETKLYSDTIRETSIFTGEEYVKELYLLNFAFHATPYDSLQNLTISSEATPYLWRTQSLTVSGEYHDTVWYANTMCIDSLFTLNLTVEDVKDSVVNETICAGDTLLWRCQELSEAGEYNDKVTYAVSGNDSIRFTLNLTVRKDSIAPWDTVYVKPSEFPYDWNGWASCAAPGEYEYQTKYAPLANQVEGCDSILFRVRIVLRDSTEGYTCNGDTMLWRCQEAYETKIYSEEVTGVGEISGETITKELYYLDFTYHAVPVDSLKNDTVTYSPYLWRGQSLTEDGTYRDTVYYDNNPEGCIDSLFTLNLKIELAIDSITYDTICAGDTVLWRCIEAVETGVYTDTLRYESGNDSIRFEFHLEVHKDSIAPIDTIVICNNEEQPDLTEWEEVDGDGYNYQRQTYYPKTQYQLEDAHGCDSVLYRLKLIVNPMRDTTMTDTICYDPLMPQYTWKSWHDTTFQIPTTDITSKWYTFTDTVRYSGSTDCDSVRYKTEVYVRRTDGRFYVTTDSICADGGNVPMEYNWVIKEDNNRPVTVVLTPAERAQQGKFVVTRMDTVYYLPTSKGYECDSAYYQLNLYVFRPKLDPNDPLKLDTLVTDTTICYGETVEWFGETYSATTRAERTEYFHGTECDSIYHRLQLKVRDQASIDDDGELIICEGTDVEWRGKLLSEPGEYSDTEYYSGTECDSVYHRVKLSVLTIKRDTAYAEFCQNGSYIWTGHGDRELTETGWYYDTLKYSSRDCDSIIFNLYLKELVPVEMEVKTDYICNGETYEWLGKTYNQTGTYYDTIRYAVSGCDSAFCTLQLEKQPAMMHRDTTLYICDGTPVELILNGQTYTYDHGTSVVVTIPSVHGCDSIEYAVNVKEQYSIQKEPENRTIYQTQKYTWIDGEDYDEPGTYEYKEYYASGCDSIIYTLNLTVLDIDYRYADDVVDTVCYGATYEEHGKLHVITEHTQWYDTTRMTDTDDALVDLITKYDMQVYELSLPDNFMNYVVAACGMPVYTDSAETILDDYISSLPLYAPDYLIVWKYSTDGGKSWSDLDPYTAVDGQLETITIRCEVTSDCGSVFAEKSFTVGRRTTPETYTDYDFLPIISKYNGTLLLVDVEAICLKFGWSEGVHIRPENVQWYQRVGKLDNLTYPDSNDPKDIAMNIWGYYYTPEQKADYYALIKGQFETNNEECGVLARTIVVESSLLAVQLQPSVARGGEQVTITNTTDCYRTVKDIQGNVVVNKEKSNTFKAPPSAGTYIVVIEDGTGVYYRTLIVY